MCLLPQVLGQRLWWGSPCQSLHPCHSTTCIYPHPLSYLLSTFYHPPILSTIYPHPLYPIYFLPPPPILSTFYPHPLSYLPSPLSYLLSTLTPYPIYYLPPPPILSTIYPHPLSIYYLPPPPILPTIYPHPISNLLSTPPHNIAIGGGKLRVKLQRQPGVR